MDPDLLLGRATVLHIDYKEVAASISHEELVVDVEGHLLYEVEEPASLLAIDPNLGVGMADIKTVAVSRNEGLCRLDLVHQLVWYRLVLVYLGLEDYNLLVAHPSNGPLSGTHSAVDSADSLYFLGGFLTEVVAVQITDIITASFNVLILV